MVLPLPCIYILVRNNSVYYFRHELLMIISTIKDSSLEKYMLDEYRTVTYNEMLISLKKLKVENFYCCKFCRIIDEIKNNNENAIH
jgi:hypothetical protein